jgi:putative oxidoreductase
MALRRGQEDAAMTYETAAPDRRIDDRQADGWHPGNGHAHQGHRHGGHTHQRHADGWRPADHPQPPGNPAADLGLLALRVAVGGFLMGHGAQKLFGWFGGHGLEGTAGWLESMGFKPGRQWAALAGASEFGGGALTALGLLHPLGPVGTVGAMAIAALDVHGGKPVWVTEGGAELPITNIAAAAALALAGPGGLSLDRALGIRVPKELTGLAVLAVAAGVLAAETRQKPAAQPEGSADDDAPDRTPAAVGTDALVAPSPDTGPIAGDAGPERPLDLPATPPAAETDGAAAF